MRRTLIIVAMVVVAVLVFTGTQSVRRLFSVARTFREVTLERATADTFSLPGLAASLVGQRVITDLALTPDQEDRISRLYQSLRDTTPTRDSTNLASSNNQAAPFPRPLRRPAPNATALRDSIRAVLTNEQWKRLRDTRSTVETLRKGWTDYLGDPLVRDLMVQLDLTASQKTQMRALARVYTGDLATLLTISDPGVRRVRVEALFDDGWSRVRTILTPAQQAVVEDYLVTHQQQIQGGLRGLWLQGL